MNQQQIDRTIKRAPLKRDFGISNTKEVQEYREEMIRLLPDWREQQIRRAHKKYLRERELRDGKLRHPILKIT